MVLLREITEGGTRLLVPEKIDVTRKSEVFYNPEMEFPRDLSVAIYSAAGTESFCDVLSGSGARAVRIAKECSAKVLANDVNPLAVDLIKKNADRNGVEVETCGLDGNAMLAGRYFDFIDVDPFGSPVHFLDAAFRSVVNKGVLAVTATDTAALCGNSPGACVRKYDAVPLRTDYYNELGLRILLGYAARLAAKHEKAVVPVFSHCTRHYFRAYLRVLRGSSRVNSCLKNLAYLQHCPTCRRRHYAHLSHLREFCECGAPLKIAGPLWSGAYADPDFCGAVKDEVSRRAFRFGAKESALLDMVASEQHLTLPYYDAHKVARNAKTVMRPRKDVFADLESAGFRVSRTHFSDRGLRTDAPFNVLFDVIANNVK